jgi:hypothetical protein
MSCARPQVADGGEGLQICRIAGNTFNRSHVQLRRGGPPAWELGGELTTPYRKIFAYYEMIHRVSDLAGLCKHGNELSGSIKGEIFLDQLSDY